MIGVTQDLRSAQSLQQTLTAKRLVALYHDRYRRSELSLRAERQKARPPAAGDDTCRAAVSAELDKLLEQILAEAEAEEPAPRP